MNANIFREYDIRGIVGEELTDEAVQRIARAIGEFFVLNQSKRVAVGYDARVSSPRFASFFYESLVATGCDVVRIGMVPTPVLYHIGHTMEIDGGVMITGSHNPANHNGFKIVLRRSTLFGSQIQQIKDLVMGEKWSSARPKGKMIDVQPTDDYVSDIVSRIEMGTRKLKVVVDAGNGMGGVTAVPAFRRLGVDLVELHTEPDSRFPNHHPDPTVEENLQDLIAAVAESRADVGIAFDGDGDRIGVVDETGSIIRGDELMILFARSVLQDRPGSTIIAEVKCSQTLFDEIKALGGNPLMWKVGHSLIKAKMKETGAPLAGEMSGHMFFADRFYGFDDATYAGARLLEIVSKTDSSLSELFVGNPATFTTPEIRIDCGDDIKFDVVSKVAERYSKEREVITIDGARILFDHGWGLVRASNTQAILVLRFEADAEEHLYRIRSDVESTLKAAIAEISMARS